MYLERGCAETHQITLFSVCWTCSSGLCSGCAQTYHVFWGIIQFMEEGKQSETGLSWTGRKASTRGERE